jgi:hypothetical protein
VEQRLDALITPDQCSRIIGKINELIEDYKSASKLPSSIVSVIVATMIIAAVLFILLVRFLLQWTITGPVEYDSDIVKVGLFIL